MKLALWVCGVFVGALLVIIAMRIRDGGDWFIDAMLIVFWCWMAWRIANKDYEK